MTPEEALEVISEAKEAIESIEVNFLKKKFDGKYDWLGRIEDTINRTGQLSERQEEVLGDIVSQLVESNVL